MTTKVAGYDQFQIRLPPGMRDRIKVAAAESGRSMNAELVHALEQVFPPEPTVQEAQRALLDLIELMQRTRVPEMRDVLFEATQRLDETYKLLKRRLPTGESVDQIRRSRMEADAAGRREIDPPSGS